MPRSVARHSAPTSSAPRTCSPPWSAAADTTRHYSPLATRERRSPFAHCGAFATCAEEDSNLHPVIPDQALNLVTRLSYPSVACQIVRIVRSRGRYGRIGRSGCCHGCCHEPAVLGAWRRGEPCGCSARRDWPVAGSDRRVTRRPRLPARRRCLFADAGNGAGSIARRRTPARRPGRPRRARPPTRPREFGRERGAVSVGRP